MDGWLKGARRRILGREVGGWRSLDRFASHVCLWHRSRIYTPDFLVLSGGGFDPTSGNCFFFRLGLRLLFFSLAAALGLVVRWCFL